MRNTKSQNPKLHGDLHADLHTPHPRCCSIRNSNRHLPDRRRLTGRHMKHTIAGGWVLNQTNHGIRNPIDVNHIMRLVAIDR